MVCLGNLLTGLAVTFILGWAVRFILKFTKSDSKVLPGKLKGLYKKLGANFTGGNVLGILERLLVFGAFSTGYKNGALVTGAWLVFKAGSKWEAWANIVKVPEKLGIPGVSKSDELLFRYWWASERLLSFQVGTLWNILCGVSGAMAMKALKAMNLCWWKIG